jgi:hypothetical protein
MKNTLVINDTNIQEKTYAIRGVQVMLYSNDFYINQLQKQITKLKEYKATLIDSVVNGKVREL